MDMYVSHLGTGVDKIKIDIRMYLLEGKSCEFAEKATSERLPKLKLNFSLDIHLVSHVPW